MNHLTNDQKLKNHRILVSQHVLIARFFVFSKKLIFGSVGTKIVSIVRFSSEDHLEALQKLPMKKSLFGAVYGLVATLGHIV